MGRSRILTHREQAQLLEPWHPELRIAAGPGPLTPTGEVMDGVSKPRVYQDPEGARWLGKRAPNPGLGFLPMIDKATSALQSRAGLPAAETHLMDFDGSPGSAQRMFDADPAFPDHRVDISTMAPKDVLELQKHMAFDWAISNHDAHSGNFLRDKATGGLLGIDKGQAYKYFGNDALTHDFGRDVNPPLHPNTPVYSTLWKQFGAGQGQLHDPRTGDLGSFIQGLQSIPDDEWAEHLRPYAEQSKPDPQGFLDAAVARKNNLSTDFGSLYDQALSRRPQTVAARQAARSTEYDEDGNPVSGWWTDEFGEGKQPLRPMRLPLTDLITSHDNMREVLSSGRVSDTPDDPIYVMPRHDMPGKYEIADGHHRAADALRRGLTHLDALVDNIPDDEPYEAPFFNFGGEYRQASMRRLADPTFDLYQKWKDAQSSGGLKGEFPPWMATPSATSGYWDQKYGDQAYDQFTDWLNTIDDDEWEQWERGSAGGGYPADDVHQQAQQSFESYLDNIGVPHQDIDPDDFEDDEDSDDSYEDTPGPAYDPREDERPKVPGSYHRRYYPPRAVNPPSSSYARPDPDFEEIEPEHPMLPLEGTDPYGLRPFGVGPEDYRGPEWPVEKRAPLYRGLTLDLNDPELAHVRRSLLGSEYEEAGAGAPINGKSPVRSHPLGYDNPDLGRHILDHLEKRQKTYDGGLSPHYLGPHWSTDRSVADNTFSGRNVNQNPLKLPVLLSGEWGGPIVHSTPVMTPSGWVKHGDLQVGDQVYAVDGSTTTVLEVKPEVLEDTYALHFRDGSVIECTGSHRWPIEEITSGGPRKRVVMTVHDMLRKGLFYERAARKEARYCSLPSPVVAGVSVDTEIDPYVLGYWLGDGDSECGRVTACIEDMNSLTSELDRLGIPHGVPRVTHGNTMRMGIHGIRKHLVSLGVLNNKHIPACVLRAPEEFRWGVLQGVVDSDGTISKDGLVEISVLDNQLGKDIFELAVSLGLMPFLSYRTMVKFGKLRGPYIRVRFTPQPGQIVSRLSRKSERCHARVGGRRPHSRSRTIASVPARCIRVEHEEHQYLVGSQNVPTCNTGEDPYRANTGGAYPAENEITLLPGAPVNITDVQIGHPNTKAWHSVLDSPHERTAAVLRQALGQDWERI